MKPATLVFLVATVLVAVLAWRLTKPVAGGDSTGRRVLGDFRPETVTAISIEGPDGAKARLELDASSGEWGVRERGGYPADAGLVRDLLREAWQMKVVQRVSLGEGSAARLQLVPPVAHSGPDGSAAGEVATLVTFFAGSNQTVAELLLGRMRTSEPSGGMPGRAVGRYVMLPGADAAALVSETFANAAASPAPWLDKAFLEISDVVALSRTGDNGWFVKREHNGWVPDPGEAGKVFQPAPVSAALSLWRAPVFDDLGDPQAVPQESPDVVTLITKGGFTYRISRGPQSGDTTPIRVKVTGAFPQPHTLDNNETNDPVALREKWDSLLQRAEQFQNHVYIVPTDTVQALFLDRPSLFTPAPEAAAASPTP